MIVCIDCFKLFQTISNKNKTCNGPGGQSESENRTWHQAQTFRRKNVFYTLFERIISKFNLFFYNTWLCRKDKWIIQPILHFEPVLCQRMTKVHYQEPCIRSQFFISQWRSKENFQGGGQNLPEGVAKFRNLRFSVQKSFFMNSMKLVIPLHSL